MIYDYPICVGYTFFNSFHCFTLLSYLLFSFPLKMSVNCYCVTVMRIRKICPLIKLIISHLIFVLKHLPRVFMCVSSSYSSHIPIHSQHIHIILDTRTFFSLNFHVGISPFDTNTISAPLSAFYMKYFIM